MGYGGLTQGNLNYSLCFNLLANTRGHQSRVIGNNTKMVRQENRDICIRHWSTNIITFKPDGDIIVDTNGYHTVTTKSRLTHYLSNSPYSRNGEWLIDDENGIAYKFEDGMSVVHVSGQPVLAEKMAKYLKLEIPDYAALLKTISSLTIDQLMKVWKRYRRERALIAQHCVPEFLPLAMATVMPDNVGPFYSEAWRKVISDRLRGA